MSEYQRYEFMTSDRPLTREELEAVNEFSSHIEASSTHAVIEYNWGDFKHDPIRVLQDFFDGFLYWANWGAPRLAFRFPHGVLPANLLDDYDCDDFVTFNQHKKYDILDIYFGEMEAPDEWVDYELGSLMPIRDELMEGDLRPLYIVWLAFQAMMEGYDDVEEEEYRVSAPPVPPGLGALTSAQQALAELLQMPDELLAAAARHSGEGTVSPEDDFVSWLDLLPAKRQRDYLLRLARNEPGLSRLLVFAWGGAAPRPRRENSLPVRGVALAGAKLARKRETRDDSYRQEKERGWPKVERSMGYNRTGLSVFRSALSREGNA